MITKVFTAFSILVMAHSLNAQQADSIKSVQLQEIDIYVKPKRTELTRMPETKNGCIYAGKKNEVITLGNIDADLSINNMRQVFGKVPGVTVWENDGSGLQVAIATRGLSPNRSWEFNTRQDGGDISGETFGYPEAYYSPPLEAIERIELVRGAGALQYGSQFGGSLNYVVKKGNSRKPFSFETQQTGGNYGLFNSYNAVGGTVKKISYYSFFHHRESQGWRKNNQYQTNTGYASITYSISPKIQLSASYTRSDYKSKQPGGLTDKLFDADAQQSVRSRNWMLVPWNVANMDLVWKFGERTTLFTKLFGISGQRNSVGFVAPLTIADTFNVNIGSFNGRQVDLDTYLNAGAETRLMHQYTVSGCKQTLSFGVRVYNGDMTRKQLGKGSTGSDADLTISDPVWGRDLNYKTENAAVFAEHLVCIGKRLSITPGIRFEQINNKASGYYRINSGKEDKISSDARLRQIFLAGVGAEFTVTKRSSLYLNGTQNYRPITFSELTPSSTTEVVDPNLKDASGYNADAGYRGQITEHLNFDIGAFYLHYDNRIGTITKDGAPFRTNIGTSVSKGVELYVEWDALGMIFQNGKYGHLSLYASYSYVDAKYEKWNNPAIVNDPTKTLVGRRVEYAPQQTGRYGLTYIFKKCSFTCQYNYVDAVYADALNTETPNSTATIGKVPSYSIIDMSASVGIWKYFNVKAGVNNLADTKYFTRRAGGYPGPGLMPGNGRTIFVGLGAKF